MPTLGICYGFQVMAQQLGGEVANTGLREYGATDAALSTDGGVLLGGQPAEQNVWMSHGDQGVARSRGLRGARIHRTRLPLPPSETTSVKFYGVQWHPEVKHSDHGKKSS